MRKYQKKKAEHVTIAKERIRTLFDQAEKVFHEDPELSNRYVELARKIAMKFKVRIPRELKRRFCKHCKTYLVPSVNCSVRTHEGHVVYYCKTCRKYMRFPYRREQKEKRKK